MSAPTPEKMVLTGSGWTTERELIERRERAKAQANFTQAASLQWPTSLTLAEVEHRLAALKEEAAVAAHVEADVRKTHEDAAAELKLAEHQVAETEGRQRIAENAVASSDTPATRAALSQSDADVRVARARRDAAQARHEETGRNARTSAEVLAGKRRGLVELEHRSRVHHERFDAAVTPLALDVLHCITNVRTAVGKLQTAIDGFVPGVAAALKDGVHVDDPRASSSSRFHSRVWIPVLEELARMGVKPRDTEVTALLGMEPPLGVGAGGRSSKLRDRIPEIATLFLALTDPARPRAGAPALQTWMWDLLDMRNGPMASAKLRAHVDEPSEPPSPAAPPPAAPAAPRAPKAAGRPNESAKKATR
jgi:hypothetical protein